MKMYSLSQAISLQPLYEIPWNFRVLFEESVYSLFFSDLGFNELWGKRDLPDYCCVSHSEIIPVLDEIPVNFQGMLGIAQGVCPWIFCLGFFRLGF